MRIILFIALMIFGFTAFSQPWRDSLDFARNAYKKGEFEKALRYYKSVQKKAPNGVDLSDEMAQSAYKAREFEKAEKIYQQSASSKKDKTSKSRSYHNLGNSRMKKKDYQGAVDAYKEALRNDPKNEKTRYNLSEAIRKLKEEQQKQQQKDQKQDKKDQQNQDQDQKNKNDQDQNKGKEQDQQQNKQQQNKGENKNQQGGKSGNPSSLPNNSVERMLDELMKAEAATKRKAGGNKNGSTSTKSGKDW